MEGEWMGEDARRDESQIERERRLAANESVFREVNERIAEMAERLEADETERWDFLCECARSGCAERISLTSGEYAHVRARPNRFAVSLDHAVADIERVVERLGDYEIVEKDGEAGRVAVELEPV